MNTLSWLVKREYWEHRGGFFWAPVWTACIFLFFVLSALIVGEVMGARFGDKGFQIHISGPLNELIAHASPETIEKVGVTINAALATFAGVIQIVLAFVLFFYLLGALYDDRRDRSVLFWKSLPISDTHTVASKILTVAVIAPLIAFCVTLVMHVAFLALVGVFLAFHGINPFFLLNVPGLLSLWVKLFAMMPLNAMWALPCYGWLLLCSSFARSKPFLWAIVPPVLLGWLLSMSDIIGGSIPQTLYWTHICGRLLLGVIPGGWSWQSAWSMGTDFEREGPLALINWPIFGNALGSLELWIGALAGVIMLGGAVYCRRFRTEISS